MATLYLETPYSRVKLHSERLFVLAQQEKNQPDHLLAQIPLHELERVVIREQVFISTPALVELMRRNIPVHVLDAYGQPLADCLPALPLAGQTRLLQYQRALEPAFALSVARALVQAKVFNQHRLVQRLESNHALGLDKELGELDAYQAKAPSADSLDRLRGLEGASTALYFQLWARFLPVDFPFERRSSRPPHNPVNACISFGATLLYHELRAAVHVTGLDAALGFFHNTEDGRCSLALDLMEPFRPAIGEALTLRLFSLGMLAAADFEPSHNGIYLNAPGRKTFLQQYEQRLTREFMSEHAHHRTTLRHQLREAALNLKAALSDAAAFNPFRLN